MQLPWSMHETGRMGGCSRTAACEAIVLWWLGRLSNKALRSHQRKSAEQSLSRSIINNQNYPGRFEVLFNSTLSSSTHLPTPPFPPFFISLGPIPEGPLASRCLICGALFTVRADDWCRRRLPTNGVSRSPSLPAAGHSFIIANSPTLASDAVQIGAAVWIISPSSGL